MTNGTIIVRPMTPEEKEIMTQRIAAKRAKNKGKKPPHVKNWKWPNSRRERNEN